MIAVFQHKVKIGKFHCPKIKKYQYGITMSWYCHDGVSNLIHVIYQYQSLRCELCQGTGVRPDPEGMKAVIMSAIQCSIP